MNLDQIPFADRFLGRAEDYYWEQWLYTSIGCPWNCRMCSAKKSGGCKVRYRSVDNVLGEIASLKRLGVNSFRFCDYTFTASNKRVVEFCQKLKASGLKTRFFINSRVDTLDQKVLDSLQAVGVREFFLVVESGSERIL